MNWKKRPIDGWMKHVVFVLNLDGYWIEKLEKFEPKVQGRAASCRASIERRELVSSVDNVCGC